MEEHRLLGLGLLCLAVLLLANPLYLFQHPDEVNEIRYRAEYDGTPAANYSYDNLSAPARDLVERASAADDGEVRFRGDHERPPEFTFVDDGPALRVAGTVTAVTDGNATFYVESRAVPTANTEHRRSTGLLALGGVLLLIGGLFVRREQPLAIGAIAGAPSLVLLVLNVEYRYSAEVFGLRTALSGPVTITAVLLAAIVSLGYLVYRTLRERRMAGGL